MRAAVAVREKAAIARPLAVLVPLINDELNAGNRAGLEHYRRAGEMLIEAREQVAPFKWGKWLKANFALSRQTAHDYQALAQRFQQDPEVVQRAGQTIRSILHSSRKVREAVKRQIIDATAKIDVDEFALARQVRADEVQLHRDLALDLIDLGYKALATRLHPDRGGSKDAMRRLNRVRDELKTVAATRRFE